MESSAGVRFWHWERSSLKLQKNTGMPLPERRQYVPDGSIPSIPFGRGEVIGMMKNSSLVDSFLTRALKFKIRTFLTEGSRMNSKRITERNKEIFRLYNQGHSLDFLASKFGLAKGHLKNIVYELKYRNKNTREDTRMDTFYEMQRSMERFRLIRVGDVLRLHHISLGPGGMLVECDFAGEVIFKDGKIVTVKGDFYAESFQLFDLLTLLVEHIPA